MTDAAWDEDGIPPPGVRKHDWSTSEEADRMVSAKKPTQRLRMLGAYVHAPQTDEEAARYVGVLDSCYWKRASELRYMGLIEPTGEARLGRAGVHRIVCRITDSGTELLRRRAWRTGSTSGT